MEEIKDYVSFDLEFNTVDGVEHLLQVSAIKYLEHVEVESFDSYVYSAIPIKSFITGLTGITAHKIKTAPSIEQVLQNFTDFIGDLPLMGYNGIKSDIPVLQHHGLDLSDQYEIDVFLLAKEMRETYLRGSQGLSLVKVAQHLGIRGRGHNSLEDARMTAKVYQALVDLKANAELIKEQESLTHNPFAGLGLANLFSSDED